MTDIHIEGVLSKADLRQALARVHTAFDDAENAEVLHEIRCQRETGTHFVCEANARPLHTNLVPCPECGTHRRLTECWLCWSDVVRGAAIETDVLSDSAWEEGLHGLTGDYSAAESDSQ